MSKASQTASHEASHTASQRPRHLAARLGLLLVLGLASANAPARAQQVDVGVGAPLTGPDAAFGEEIRLGAEQAAADINAEGGILNRRVHLIVADDGSDPKKAETVARRFVESGVKIVIGHVSSAVALPTSATYAGAGLLDLVPAATAPQLTDRGFTTIFRLTARSDAQPDAAVGFLLARHYASIAILHDRTSAGKGFADAVRARLATRGIAESFYGSLPPEPRDLSGVVARVRAAGAQIIVWGGGPGGAALLARQLHDGRPSVPLLGSAALGNEDFPQTAGSAADGTFVVFAPDPKERPDADALLRRWKARGVEPYLFAFNAYAALQLVREAAVRAQSTEPARLAAALRTGVPYETVLGPLAFDDKGDLKTPELSVHVWRRSPTGHPTLVPAPES